MVRAFTNRSLAFAVKLAFSAVFLGILVFETRTASYSGTISTISLRIIASVIGIVVLQMAVISAVRLKLVMAIAGHRVRAIDAACITWCGFFFEQVGAVFVAGDAARAYLLREVGVGLRAASQGVLLDRAIGFATIGAMAMLGMPRLWWGITLTEQRLFLLVAGWAFCALIAVSVLLLLTIRERLVHWRKQLHAFILSVIKLLAEAPRSRLAAVVVFATSTHSLNVVAIYLLLQAVGLDIGLGTCFVFVPSVLLASMLPASVSGWGVREGALVLALQSSGIPSDHVVIASVMFGLCVLAASVPGAAIWLFLRKRESQFWPVHRKTARTNDRVQLSP